MIKLPRFAFEKFPGADDSLTTQMKSVGEVMGIGRTLQRGVGQGDALARAGRHAAHDGQRRRCRCGTASTPSRARLLAGERPGGAGRASRACTAGSSTSGRAVAEAERSVRGVDPASLDAGDWRRLKRLGIGRCPDRDADRPRRARGAAAAQGGRRAAGVQGRRQLRRRGRGARALLLLGLRARGRARPRRAAERDHPRRRPQPDRPGHRVRLLLRAGRPDAARAWATTR